MTICPRCMHLKGKHTIHHFGNYETGYDIRLCDELGDNQYDSCDCLYYNEQKDIRKYKHN